MSYRLHNITSFEPVGSTVYHYGYKCEVKEDGSVWADVPKELYELELSAGRIRVEQKKTPEPVIEPPKQPDIEPEEETLEQLQVPSAKFVEVDGDTKPEVAVEQPAVVEDTVKVEVAPVKIDGRSKTAKQNNRYNR